MKSNFFHYHRYEKPFINRDTFIFRCLVGIRTEILSHFFPYIQFTRFMHLWIDLSVALMKQPIFHNMVNQFDKYLNDKRLLIIRYYFLSFFFSINILFAEEHTFHTMVDCQNHWLICLCSVSKLWMQYDNYITPTDWFKT